MENSYDVYGIGNAIVDTEVQIEELLLTAHGLEKGIMTLVSTDEQSALLDGLAGYDQHGAAGGSAANTIVGVAQFGGKAFFSGKVGADMSGALYRESMAEAGVDLEIDAANGSPTGTCLILVTPDGERTMRTSLGASAELAASDVDEARIARSKIIYVEGYLFGSPTGSEAAVRAMEIASAAPGVKVSLTLSDPGMAEHFIDQFRSATKRYTDILFCNEHEAMIYTGKQTREAALNKLGEDCSQVFMTCGGDGSLVLSDDVVTTVAGYAVPVVDTTGAGDIYAAGVLYGLTNGMDVAQAGKLGSFASAKIVTQLGPRLQTRLGNHLTAIMGGAHPTEEF